MIPFVVLIIPLYQLMVTIGWVDSLVALLPFIFSFAFLYAWHSFVWPLVVINSGNLDNRVLALSLQGLGGRAADQPNLILAGVVSALLPPITVVVLAQRYVENVTSSGPRG